MSNRVHQDADGVNRNAQDYFFLSIRIFPKQLHKSNEDEFTVGRHYINEGKSNDAGVNYERKTVYEYFFYRNPSPL